MKEAAMRQLRKKSLHQSHTSKNCKKNPFSKAEGLSATSNAKVKVNTIERDGKTCVYKRPSIDTAIGRYLMLHWSPPTLVAQCMAMLDEHLHQYIERKHEEEGATLEEETLIGGELKEMQWSVEFLEGMRTKVTKRLQELNSRSSETSTSGLAE